MKIKSNHIDIYNDWRNDWCKFAKDVLKVNLDTEQQRILRALQTEKMVSVVSGTARGKDFLSAVACMCFMYLTPRWNANGEMIENTKVAMTAPTGRQVGDIMYPEISRLFKRAKVLPGRLVGYDIRTGNDEWFLTGFKADENNKEAWTGFHAANVMFVVTEASGIPDSIFEAIEGNLQGNSRLLLVFNFNSTIGYAARSQKSPRFRKFRLNSLNSPNVKSKKIIIPGQVDWDWVNDKVEHWCQVIDKEEFNEGEGDFEWEGLTYRPNDVFRIKILGLPPKSSEDTLIPLEWIELAHERWRNSKRPNIPLRVGADVAGMGTDTSMACNRYGDYVEDFETYYGNGKAEHMKFAGILANKLKTKSTKAFIDTIGEGAGVYSRLEELGHSNAFSCKFSESANGLNDITGVYEFSNLRAYLFWAVRDWLNPLHNDKACLPPDDTLTEELTEIRYKFQSNGRIIIEPKDDIKKRLKRSPDKADALANTFYPHDKQQTGWDATQLANYL